MNELETVQQLCPYCGEPIALTIDCSVPEQEYIEDCQVCCRPMMVTVTIDNEGDLAVSLRSENE